jgi:hypothetical protein
LLSAPACGSVTGYLGAYQMLLALTRRALLMFETQPHWVRPTSTLGYDYPEQIDLSFKYSRKSQQFIRIPSFTGLLDMLI